VRYRDESASAEGFMKVLVSAAVIIAATAAGSSAAPVTFNDVASIVYAKCAGCHRPGESGPFSLTSYAEVAKRGKLIAAVTAKRYMPPWHAEPAAVAYRDERRLSDAQLALLQDWVKQGMPEGDPKQAPKLPDFPTGWQLGKPDLVVSLAQAYRIPASGPDIYRDFVIPVGLGEDKWVRAIEVRPSAPKAVHHMLYYGDPTGSLRQADGASGLPGFAGLGLPRGTVGLGTWAAGTQPHFLPDGIARPFPKGSDLVIQEHFHPSGKEEMEKTVVGLYFAKSAPERRMLSVQLPPEFGLLAGIRIPAGEKSYTVRDSYTLPVDVDAFAASAHTHYIGKSMKLTATLPSGETKVLLWIKDWDFAWQDGYVFSDFVALPKGTRLDGEVTWDNSAENPHNPSNPPVEVAWGEQSRAEMGSVTLELVPARQTDRNALTADLSERMKRITTAAFQREPGLQERIRDISTGRSAVFQAGEPKR
jgi:mono/diheme cytochrome c family protein